MIIADEFHIWDTSLLYHKYRLILIITAFRVYGNFWTSARFQLEAEAWIWPSGNIVNYNLATPVGEGGYLYVDGPESSTPRYKAGNDTVKMRCHCEASK